MRRRTFRNGKGRRRRSAKLHGGACPPGVPARICQKIEEREKRNKYSVTRNFKSNLEQALRNREKRLMPEEERAALARAKFNWKSSVPKFNAIRRGDVEEENNINNTNVHDATNINFPLPKGEPAAFGAITSPPPLGTMRRKIYKNNNNII